MKNRLSLNDMEWGKFKISDLFNVSLSKGDNKADLLGDGDIPLISSGFNNNGITKFIVDGDGISEIIKRNTITVDMFGKAFYQPFKYFAVSHGRINILSSLTSMSKETLKFIVSCINESTKNIFSYNRMCSSTRLSKLKILLPIDNQNKPNWQFMEDYIKQEQKKIAENVINYYEQKILETAFDLVGFEDVEWKVFPFDKLFRKIQRGKRLKKADHIDGNIAYVSSTGLNNGVDGFIGNKKDVRFFRENLTIANSGSVGSCFYHQYEYIASDHVTSLTLENADKHIYLFMATIIKRLEEKYSFNREINDKRIRTEKIILPADKKGNPHWDYMSKFMQKLEVEKLEKALEYIYLYIYIYIYIYRLAISEALRLPLLKEKEWKEFWLEDLVDISGGRDIYAKERIDGDIPYVTGTANNNGIGYFISNKNPTLERGCISVNRNGSVGYAFYHPYEALYGNDTRKLRSKYKDKYYSMFLVQSIKSQKEKYGYGYKMGTARLKRQKIMLPVNNIGGPDFVYMKKYMQIEEIKAFYQTLDYYKKKYEN
ncbi:restriction endonuclease subunit S [Facklamia sp. P13069]|uniref:restriction endonuclease subunit S n=1 Tax=Facklamia sp. P13069 TaxID=3421954 RepID=UPI003D1673DF